MTINTVVCGSRLSVQGLGVDKFSVVILTIDADHPELILKFLPRTKENVYRD